MNEAQKQALKKVLEEASDLITNRLISNAITSNGVITLEEASFLNKLSKEVLFEAAEVFIPSDMDPTDPTDPTDSLNDVQDDNNIQDNMILKDDEGNEYMFHPDTGTLEALSVKPEEESLGTIGPEDQEDQEVIGESTEALTESETIVQNLLRFI